ncbi:MAG TPA: pentapeptide repeat-containing protein [Ktedonobacteraceae bacterium]|nr:pentapeptide repeat-containing protein [Ktedonobacteraceae bacterium]
MQAYLDRMSELLLEKKLHGARPDDEVFDVVRVRTTTVLCQLDGWRVGYVFVFLRGTRLMCDPPGSSLVRLAGADFRTVNWSQGYLTQTNLSGTNLSRADLSRTDLSGASLSEANLTQANLSDADLSGANLSCANLTRADFSGADLSGSDLSRATGTTIEQLKKARSLKDATMPDGLKHL